jgi:hypothetical protein
MAEELKLTASKVPASKETEHFMLAILIKMSGAAAPPNDAN